MKRSPLTNAQRQKRYREKRQNIIDRGADLVETMIHSRKIGHKRCTEYDLFFLKEIFDALKGKKRQ
jgi:hypothetical protein